MTRVCRCLNCIVPPHLLKKLLESNNIQLRRAALDTLLSTAKLRGERSVQVAFASAATGSSRRSIFDCKHSTNLSRATLARSEGGPATRDAAVNSAYDGFGATSDFYKQILHRDSIDDRGMRLNGYVHRGRSYNNAFWDGREMVFGDGDGLMFTDFTKSIDVIAHELTHGVTEHTAGLEYHEQSGALNESISDVFGSLVKQWRLKQTAAQADWLIGVEVFTPGVKADALRSMKAPGTAYDNEDFGKDPQPDHMNHYQNLPDTEEGDNGGVHINSGIPNKAFFVTATELTGFAWEAPGHIWYEALKASGPTTNFQEFASTTYAKAGQLYGLGSAQQKAVLTGWREVGIEVGSMALVSSEGGDTLTVLTKRIEALSAQVDALAQEIRPAKAA